jgi:hypothetical protein
MTGSAWAVEVGVDATLAFYRWEEHTQSIGSIDPIDPLETGPMVLVGGWLRGAPVPAHTPLRLRGDLRLMVGYVNYDTALLAAPTVPVTTQTAYFGSIQEASVGWHMKRNGGFLEPFAAVAYRWWLRSIESNSTVTGYDEWYQTLVLRLGMRGELAMSDYNTLYWEVSGDPMLWASEAVDGLAPGEVLYVENGKQVGWTIDTGFRTRFLSVGLFWQGVRLGESTVDCISGTTTCYGQPPSDQDIIGLRLGRSF